MDTFPWIVIGIAAGLILIVILAVVVLRRKRAGQPAETDYRVFFILGMSFSPLGLIYFITYFVSSSSNNTVFLVLGLSFFGMGVSYLAIGLANKDKWRKK